MPAAFAVLIGAQLLGEVMQRVLHLPLPGPVIGMFLLAVALLIPCKSWVARRDNEVSALEQASSSLIANMGLLFIPAGVGIVTELAVLKRDWLPILMGLLVSTVLGLVVTGLVMHHITRRAAHPDAEASVLNPGGSL
ncbi:CidA/LrgA family protein [Dyella flava]|uniref:CidA/LrgA family protein n=1 Tax=Dyella flava TaxID=1920170 RepID=A0ABS2JYK5_9GAMM|nr:CidA/LrgA family protein [Dyella flava]